jgi:hypothetical protein
MLPVTLPQSKELTASCVRDSVTGEVVLKVVTRSDEAQTIRLDLSAVLKQPSKAVKISWTGEPDSEKATADTVTLPAADKFELTIPRHSLTILRVK